MTIFTVVLLALLVGPSSSLFSVRGREGSFPIYNSSPWLTEPIANISMLLVNITADRKVFDYCDLSQYNDEYVKPLLHLHGYNSSLPSLKWAVFYPDPHGTLPALCSHISPFSQTAPILANFKYYSVFVERLGAFALVDNTLNSIWKYWSFSNLDTVRGVSYLTYDDASNDVKVNIPTLTIDDSSKRYFGIQPSGDFFTSQHRILDIVSDDYNDMWTIHEPLSPYRIASYVNVLLGVLCFMDLLRVTKVYYEAFDRRFPSSYSTMTLAVNYIAYPLKVAMCLDPLYGFLGVLPRPVARIGSTLAQELTIVSLCATIFAWNDILIGIGKSLQMQFVKSRSRNTRSIAVVCAVTLLIADVCLGWWDQFVGRGGIFIMQLPGFVCCIIDISVAIGCVVTCIRIRSMIKKLQTKIGNKVSPAPPTPPVEMLVTATGTAAVGGGNMKPGQLKSDIIKDPATTVGAIAPGTKTEEATTTASKMSANRAIIEPAASRTSTASAAIAALYTNIKVKLESSLRLMEINSLVLLLLAALLLSMPLFYQAWFVSKPLLGLIFHGGATLLLLTSFVEVRLVESISKKSSTGKHGK